MRAARSRTVFQRSSRLRLWLPGFLLTKFVRPGGYLAYAKDPQPGNTVMWRGLPRLNDITLGATLQADLVGN